ncbi:uncharacterized protein LOC126837121 [Adelges cooleyi]|uniref:uncharacterized protein LOC126837121 n=1 Tax=Adelges cooleyi TaxID=133065 RepID=UPI00217F5579|nr:uncharacterized protein LOC126837121 [Adelges cooleyi]
MKVALSIVVIALIDNVFGCTQFDKFSAVCNEAIQAYAIKHPEMKYLRPAIDNFIKALKVLSSTDNPSRPQAASRDVTYSQLITQFNIYISEGNIAAAAQEMVDLQNGLKECDPIAISDIKC